MRKSSVRLCVAAVIGAAAALSGCVALVGGLGANWHYERNTEAFDKDNAERQIQGLPPLTREEWNQAREARAAGANPPEPE